MFIITNREVSNRKSGFDQVGARPNRKGPNELRILEATRSGNNWNLEILSDVLSADMKREIDVAQNKKFYASTYVAKKVLGKIRKEKKNLLLFIHGFNNDLEAVVNRAQNLADTYNVEVVAFSWPANGGGIKGVASYKSDKRDAKASVGALDRVLEKFSGFLNDFNNEVRLAVYKEAEEKYENNLEDRNIYITQRMEEECPFTVNMMLHSMGNYLYKHLLLSSVYTGNRLTFDNIVLAAADANNNEHDVWVDRIQARKRVYVTINENDFALRTSRMKSGDEQLARLGHYPYNLNSSHAVYVNFTDASKVSSSHAYFEGEPLGNSVVKDFFSKALNGQVAETKLDYSSARGLYEIQG